MAFLEKQNNLHCSSWLFYFTSRSYLTVTGDWKQEGAMEVMLCHPCAYSLSFWSNEYSISWYKLKGFQIESAAENRCVLHSSICLPSTETQKNPVCDQSYSPSMWRINPKFPITFIGVLGEIFPIRGVIVSALFGRTKGQRQRKDRKPRYLMHRWEDSSGGTHRNVCKAQRGLQCLCCGMN